MAGRTITLWWWPMLVGPLLLGHRGARRSGAPENTTAAFDAALTQGCDGFEFDVRRAACGCGVVSHGPKVKGITIARADGRQARKLLRVEEVIRQYGRRAFLDIELKVRRLETRVLAALREQRPERDYVVSSFLPQVVLELKARSETVPVGIICGKPSELIGWQKLPVEYVIAKESLVNRGLVERVHDAGRKIFVWTVNDKASMLRLAAWGVDAIISDEARLLVETLRPKHQSPPYD